MNVRNLEKIRDKWLLFQRFVTSIVGVQTFHARFRVPVKSLEASAFSQRSVGPRARPEHQVVIEKKTSGTQVKSIATRHQVKCNIKIAGKN